MLDEDDFTHNQNFGWWPFTPLTIVISCLAFYKFIEMWRGVHMQKQMRIVRAMLYKLSVAPFATRKEYEYWRTGNLKRIEICSECGPIYDTSLELYDMKLKLGPEASSVLLLYFLDLANVSSVANPVGTHACRWARIIGQLPNIYASTHEDLIMSEFNITRNRESMVWIMLYLCGPNCMLTTRMFLLWRTCISKPDDFIYRTKVYKTTDQPDTPDYHPKIDIPLPRQLSCLPPGFPTALLLDVQYHNDRLCSARTEWIDKLRKARNELWGEKGVSIERVLSLVGCSQLDGSRLNCNMGSILSPL